MIGKDLYNNVVFFSLIKKDNKNYKRFPFIMSSKSLSQALKKPSFSQALKGQSLSQALRSKFSGEMVLIQPYNPQKAEESNFCLQKNLECDLINQIILFTGESPRGNHPKLMVEIHKKKLTYYDVFNYANRSLKKDTILIVSQSDIFLTDEDLM